MKLTGISVWVAGLLVVFALPALAQESGSEIGILKRAAQVDDPIPETYEPLNSTYVGDGERLNETIEQSWQLKKEAKAREEAAAAIPPSPERQALEQRIQEPGSGPQVLAEPQVRDTGNGLQIKDP
jgi:hypothetical protein